MWERMEAETAVSAQERAEEQTQEPAQGQASVRAVGRYLQHWASAQTRRRGQQEFPEERKAPEFVPHQNDGRWFPA